MSFATSKGLPRRSRLSRWPRWRTPIACLGALGVLAACGGGDPTGPAAPIDLPRPLSQAERTVIGASNSFAFDLLGRVAATEPKPNVFLSPLSRDLGRPAHPDRLRPAFPLRHPGAAHGGAPVHRRDRGPHGVGGGALRQRACGRAR